MTPLEQQLRQDLEAAVKKFLIGCRAQAHATVDRALGAAGPTSASPRKAKARKSSDPSKRSKRRTADELAALSEQLYEAIAASPGQTMVVFSEQMGVSPLHLQPAVARLRADNRIRTVGARQQTRYFPMA
jgi:hypothetical protein